MSLQNHGSCSLVCALLVNGEVTSFTTLSHCAFLPPSDEGHMRLLIDCWLAQNRIVEEEVIVYIP